MSHLIGYARVSTTEQDPQLQLEALTAAGCARIFTESASGVTTSRPELDAALNYLRQGDQLVVWRLDRLGRSLPHLLDVLAQLDGRGVGFRSLQDPASHHPLGPQPGSDRSASGTGSRWIRTCLPSPAVGWAAREVGLDCGRPGCPYPGARDACRCKG